MTTDTRLGNAVRTLQAARQANKKSRGQILRTRPAALGLNAPGIRQLEQYVTGTTTITFDPHIGTLATSPKTGSRMPRPRRSSQGHDSLFSSSGSPSPSPTPTSNDQPSKISTAPHAHSRNANAGFTGQISRQLPQPNHNLPAVPGYYRIDPHLWQVPVQHDPSRTQPDYPDQGMRTTHGEVFQPQPYPVARPTPTPPPPLPHQQQPGSTSVVAGRRTQGLLHHRVEMGTRAESRRKEATFRNLTRDSFGRYGPGGRLVPGVGVGSSTGHGT